MDFASYLLRRLVAFAFLLVLISFLVFSLLYVAPGNAVDILLGESERTPELVASLNDKYHLDEPFVEQYWIWAKGAAQLQFGDSISTTLPVTDTIKARLPVSLFLGIYAFILTMLIGVGLGIVAALKRGGAVDRGAVAVGILGLSTPVFVGGVILLWVFAIVFPWFPTFGRGDGFWDEAHHLSLPAMALAIHAAAYLMKHTRAAMINVLDQDYVTFARARGLSPSRILFLYTLRNALIPVVTIAGIVLGYLIVGAVLVEVTFSLPGIGDLLVQSANTKDMPMLQGVAVLIAAVIMLANLIADLLYALIDPRVRLRDPDIMTTDIAVEAGDGLRAHAVRSRRPSIVITLCFIVVIAVVVMAIFGELLAPQDPHAQDLSNISAKPSNEHWLGTDALGRDVFSRLVAGAGSALVGPVVVTICAVILGSVLGVAAGYRGGKLDSVIMRWVDLMFALPGLLVIIVVVGAVGGGYWLAVGVLIILVTPAETRIIRGAALEQAPRPYIEAAKTLGVSEKRIMFLHIWPNVSGTVVAQAFLTFAAVLLSLSALSFLGLGVSPGTPDWGLMLAEGRRLLFGNPVASLAPGVMIILTAMAMTLIGDWSYERLSSRGATR